MKLYQPLGRGENSFSKLLTDLREEDLTKKLFPAPNSAGFLIRHIGDVELLFAKNVFNYEGVKVHAKTVIAQREIPGNGLNYPTYWRTTSSRLNHQIFSSCS